MSTPDAHPSPPDPPQAADARPAASSGAEINAAGDVTIRGDVIGRDKIVNLIQQVAGVRALHQLPAPPADFTGRAHELEEMARAIQSGGVTIMGLQGQGGIGKTALALVLANQLKDSYPDAQFFVDLHGSGRTPVSIEEALARIIRAYHPTAKLPESISELQGLYRSALTDQKALLLLDDARDRAQVEPLLPPPGCLVLLTSRQHFVLPGLHTTDLTLLSSEEAKALLLKIAPRIAGQAGELAQLCGHLPLALRLAGSALAERPSLTASEYVRRLSVSRARLALIDASLTLSYDLLSAEQQAHWRQLAVFHGTFLRPAAAAVWEVSDDQAQDYLDELLRYSLLDWNAETGRYRLHDLTRLFADSRQSEAERAAGAKRQARHYKEVAALADELYLAGGESVRRGLALFDQEFSNIRAGQAWAAANAARDPEAARLAVDYPDASAYCFNLRLHAREQILWLEAAVAAARQLSDRRGEGNALGNLGNAHYFLGAARQAVQFYEQQLAITRALSDRSGEAAAIGNLGNAYAALGDARQAIQFYERELALTRELGDRRGQGNALGNLGNAYAALGEARQAIAFYDQRLLIARQIGDRRGEGATLGNLGNAYADLGDARQAIWFYEQDLLIAREIGDRRGEGNTLGNLANVYSALGDARQAIEAYEKRLVIAREIGDVRGEAVASWNLGDELAKAGDLPRAIAAMQVYVDYLTQIDHPETETFKARVEALRREQAGT